ncbi:hypothetical protein OG21DRAFT_1491852 [Imleria badia]|nr:hypothetical protein OG21DRAFT_1491852 [Imleria badia]
MGQPAPVPLPVPTCLYPMWVWVWQLLYHEERHVDAPQTLRAFPTSSDCSHGLYDTAVISSGPDSNWPWEGLEGHSVVQLRLVFCPANADYLAVYVQHFNIVSQQGNPCGVHLATVPVSHIQSAAHLIPSFGKQAHSRLTKQNTNEHHTPLSLCALATPPQFCRRVDAYRKSMDPKIVEDTTPVHWTLDQDQTIAFLAKLFPNDKLFPPSSSASGGMDSILTHMNKLWQQVNDHWAYFPDMSKPDDLEEKITQFFNCIVQHVPDSYLCTRRWTRKVANNPVDGLNGVIRKPDLLLCKERMIATCNARNEKFNMQIDVYALGEVKKRYSEGNTKELYVELAGKATFLLEAQDGRFATPGI